MEGPDCCQPRSAVRSRLLHPVFLDLLASTLPGRRTLTKASRKRGDRVLARQCGRPADLCADDRCPCSDGEFVNNRPLTTSIAAYRMRSSLLSERFRHPHRRATRAGAGRAGMEHPCPVLAPRSEADRLQPRVGRRLWRAADVDVGRVIAYAAPPRKTTAEIARRLGLS